MNKKADLNFTVALVLILVAGIILILLTSGMIQWFRGFFMGESCQASILKASELRVNILYESNVPILPNLDCPVEKTIIKFIDIKTKDNQINDTKVKKSIADALYKCWDKVGRGKLMPYSFNYFTGFIQSQKNCLICSEINFDGEFLKKAKEVNYKPMNLYMWMKLNKIINSNDNYFNFIYNNTYNPTEKELMGLYDYLQNDYNKKLTEKELFTFYIVWKTDLKGKAFDLKNIKGWLPIAVADYYQYIFIDYPESLSKSNLCTIIVN